MSQRPSGLVVNVAFKQAGNGREAIITRSVIIVGRLSAD